MPLAAGVLAPIGFVLPMAVGALLMSASTVVVALNAQLLRRLDLHAEPGPPGAEPDRAGSTLVGRGVSGGAPASPSSWVT